MSSGTSGGGMSGDDPNDPNSPTYGGIAAPASRGDDADDPSSPNYGGMADLYAAEAAFAEEPMSMQDFDIALEPTSLQDYDVSRQFGLFGQPTFGPSTTQKSFGDRAEEAVRNIFDKDMLSTLGVKGIGAIADMATKSYVPGLVISGLYNLAGQEPLSQDDANNPTSFNYMDPGFPEAVIEGEDPADPYARRRYILPTPQTTAPVEPMANNPLPLTPYDYQKQNQKWMGNQFILAPIRRT